MNKYSQLLKKLGLSAAALALSATLAVDSASAADENATDETVEQNVEADTTTEEKTEVLSEEKTTEATTEEAVEEKAPEETQPEQTDRLLGRTPVPHVNYNHAYFTHRTSDTVGTIFHRIILSFYINGEEQSGDYIQIYSKPNTYGLTYDQLRDKVESRINQYQELGYELVQLDDSPYDNYYNYYFVDADKLSTDGETPEKPATDKKEEQKQEAPAKEEQKPEAKPEEQKSEAGKQAEQKPAASAKESQQQTRKKNKKQKLVRNKNRNQKQARKILLAKLKLTNMTASGELLEQKKKRHNLLQESSSTMDLNN